MGSGFPENGGWGQWAFYGPGPNDGSGTIRNNIIYGAGTTASGFALVPFDGSSFTKSNNVCASGATSGCGITFVTSGASQTVMSLSPTSANFMMLNGTTSTAYHAGVTLAAVTTSYTGMPRVTPYDIGAFSATGLALRTPTNLRIVR